MTESALSTSPEVRARPDKPPTAPPAQLNTRPVSPTRERLRPRVLLGMAAALLGILFALGRRVEPPPACYFVAAWSPHLQTPLVPDNLAAANDRRCLASSRLFQNSTFHYEPSLSSTALRRQLKVQQSAEHPLVLYLSAYARVDEQGELLLLTKDYLPMRPAGHGIPLREVLETLAKSSTSQKLLVLDISWQMLSGQVGLFPEEITARALQALGDSPDDARLTLISCGVGQAAQEIPGIGRTAFGYFFEQGLRGRADKFNDRATSDGRVSVKELAAYVGSRVDAWSQRCGSFQQTPLLAGDASDFLLAVSGAADPTSVVCDASGQEYPEWLRAQWLERDNLLADAALSSFPRLVRRFEETLIEVERRWRYGQSDRVLKSYLAATVGPVKQQIARSQSSVSPASTVSVGQHVAAGNPPSVANIAAWRDYLVGQPPEGTAIAAAEQVRKKLKANLESAIEDLRSPDSIAAALQVLVSTADGISKNLAVVDEILHPKGAEPRFTETAYVRKLRELTGEDSQIDEELIQTALRLALLGEQACGLPRAEPWLGPRLHSAALRRQAGEVALFSSGFVSAQYVRTELTAALDEHEHLLGLQSSLARALKARDRACRELPASLPLVRLRPELTATWFTAVQTACQLFDRLDTQGAHHLLEQADRLEQLTSDLTEQLQTLTSSTTSSSIKLLEADLEAGAVERFGEANALLATPLLNIEDRARLISAMRGAYEQQSHLLAQMAMDTNRATIAAAVSSVDDSAARASTTNDLGALEAQFAVALNRLAGVDVAALEQLLARRQQNASSVTMSQFSQALVENVLAALPKENASYPVASGERFARVVPAGYFDPVLDDPRSSPTLKIAKLALSEWKTRQHQRFEAMAREVGNWTFYAHSAAKLGGQEFDSWFDLSGPEELTNFSESSPQGHATLQIHADSESQPSVAVLQPTEVLIADVDLQRDSSDWLANVNLSIRPAPEHQQLAATRGILLKVTLGNKLRHHAVALPRLSSATPIVLQAHLGTRSVLEESRLEIPPSAEPQPLVISLHNRSSQHQKLLVHVAADSGYTSSLSLDTGVTLPIKLAPNTESAKSAPLNLQQIEVTVRDVDTNEVVLNKVLALSTISPAQYLQVTEAALRPSDQGTCQIQVTVARRPNATEQTVVKLAPFDGESSSAYAVAGGALAATLSEKQPATTLNAKIRATQVLPVDVPVRASLVVDGVNHAFDFVGDWPAFGQSAVLRPAKAPEVAVHANTLLKSGDPLDFRIETVTAPKNTALQVLLLRPSTSGDGTLDVARERSYPYARRSAVVVSPANKAGNLLVQGQISDILGTFDTDGIVGQLTLRAMLLDADGVQVGRDEVQVICDDSPPTYAEILTGSTPAVAGAPLAVEVTATDRLSGVSDVKLFLGMPANNAVPQGVAVVPAKRVGSSTRQWSATLAMPKNESSAAVSAAITNGVGLTRFVSTELELLDPTAAALGKIAGSVVEGTRKQAGLEVELRKADQSIVAKSKTDEQGHFLFESVKPGDYLVWCTKQQSQRVGASQVTVEAGAAVQTKLDLTL